MYSYDNRVVITLDAGGTNLVFGAMQANKFIVEPITLPSHAEDLDRCLATMVEGFTAIIDKLDTKPVAISFAFPGPADYPNGIIDCPQRRRERLQHAVLVLWSHEIHQASDRKRQTQHGSGCVRAQMVPC